MSIESTFKPGDIVFEVKNPSRIGTITGRTQNAGNLVMVQVRYPDGTQAYRPEAALRKQEPGATDSKEARLEAGRYGQPRDLRRLMTYEKLRGSLHEVIYSMEAAQIDFYPYQFKPVMKFIASPTSRLLLADEVGLGKTIESALIWLELQARREARRWLVVCPNILAMKWCYELRTKFQLDARVASFADLSTEIQQLRTEGPSHSFVLVGTYTGLRPPKAEIAALTRSSDDPRELSPKSSLLKGLRDWDEAHEPFDLVVFDEAHYMRNPATTTFALGESLAANAAAVLCVSATPVNNKNKDLLSLLKLVDDSVFNTQSLFDDLMKANRPAVQVMNALVRAPVDRRMLTEAMSTLRQSFIRDLPMFARLSDAVDKLDERDPDQIATCQDLAEKVNLIGSYVNRTRRVQVSEKRPVRTARVLEVTYGEAERRLYDAILALVRRRCARENRSFHIFALMGVQLRAASCLPAFAQEVREGGTIDLDDLIDEAIGGEDMLDLADEPASGQPDDAEIAALLCHDFEASDTKYEKLRDFLLEKGLDEKVIVFAYYRRTLAYLHRRLVRDGISVTEIHGGVDLEERWKEIDRFRAADGPRVLLSSEVGSEGIDLQFCRIVVNYDLPWNPMRVEQRIGRVDRVNQEAERIIIVNFKVKDTIEERLYERLHEKLMLSQNSLGDLESVIGSQVQELARELLSNSLTPAEQIRQIERTARVIAEHALSIKSLEESGETLVALSDYVQRKIEEDRGRGRFIQPNELLAYVVDFLTECYPGTQIDFNTPGPECLRIRPSAAAYQALQAHLADDRSVAARHLRMKELSITFSADAHKALPARHRQAVSFVNHLSPLIRWITRELLARGGRFYDVSALRLQSRDWAPGEYCYRVERWTLQGLTRREHMTHGIAELATGRILTAREAEIMFNEVLRGGRHWDRNRPDPAAVMRVYQELDLAMGLRFDQAVSEFLDENTTAILMKHERVSAFYEKRIASDLQRLESLRAGGRSTSLIAATEKRIANEKSNRDAKLAKLSEARDIDPERTDVAAGVILVESHS